MWGGIFCFPASEDGGMADYRIARQRPSPLEEAFDRTCFDSLFNDETPKLSAKAFLATEQRVPGLGNGVLQDILWAAKIHPRRKMGDLSANEVQAMFEAVRNVLRAMAERGGRDTERDLFGAPGGYRTILSKNTVGQPCPQCGTTIQKEPYLGGAIYFCAGCQPLLKRVVNKYRSCCFTLL
jgi:formamidopyrimidine-DNA glycosylase